MSTPSRTLYKRPPPHVGKAAFEGDCLERGELAKRLTGLLSRLSEGCVIGLTADWGDGKSWFAQNWRMHLEDEQQGYKTLYLDSFESDFSDDAFVVIAAEILNGIGDGKESASGKRLRKASKRVGLMLMPGATKVALDTGSKAILALAVGSAAHVANTLAEQISASTEKLLEKRLQELETSRSRIAEFKDALAQSCKRPDGNPVVFFVDELDRCRPSFAVQVIERIKHFFDVPNLVFVLMLNRGQLEAAVRGIYGQDVDAGAYLGKFVHFFLSLPSGGRTRGRRKRHMEQFCWKLAAHYGYERAPWLEAFVGVLCAMAEPMRLTLRDCERAFILLGLAGYAQQHAYLAAYAAVIKMKRPELFAKLLHDEPEGHLEAAQLAQSLKDGDPSFALWEALRVLHTAHEQGRAGVGAAELKAMAPLSGGGRDAITLLRWICSSLDLLTPE